ncbi:MAG TPA: KpsF/GutQ family sugar-phosphate isomerase [Alphaproteobacteria bacterium]|nr:KpsF/GutQ family sugar-phosphate isomerase [Alphaproteobacteria bacterium]
METKATATTAHPDLASVERVLTLEAEGIRKLADACDDRIVAALDILEKVTGRVVVTGMGKSGHIARKIAATMASVGTPALYVHPGEASHGDLGMITRADAILALSYSGETGELADLVSYTRRYSIPLIAITAKADSTLAQAADVALTLPAAAEACPLGLAPTTSTTMTLALGDALAVALLERRGFSSDDFQVLHPGGRLGKRLVRVRDLMHGGDALPLVDRALAMAEALIIMTAKGFGCVGVIEADGALAGVITDGDLRRNMAPDLLGRTAGDVMTAGPKTIRPEALAAEALGHMNAKAITSLFVVADGKPIGIVRMHDCLRAGVA